MKNNILVCKSVWFYSSTDEDLFFLWLEKIPSIIHVSGSGDELYLSTKSTKIPDNDLREIIALFYRYKIDMKQLQIFLNQQNEKWFYGRPKGYWHRQIFGQ